MRHLPTPLRKRVESRSNPVRLPRRYQPHCKSLEDRCLLSVSITPSGPPVPLVGAPVIWTATASGHGTTPDYQFSVGPTGGPSQVVRDFSTSNSFTWNPMQEGTYTIKVTVEDSFGASTGESTTASYTAESRVVGTGAVISPMSNPLVALYSAPPSPGSSMFVEFSPAGPAPSWRDTAPLPIVPGESTNFIVAGMLPDTTYIMKSILNDGTVSAPLTFTTGPLPTNLTFPAFTQVQAAGPGTDLTQDMIYHEGLAPPPGTINTVATNLQGNVEWYYDSVDNNFNSYGPSLVPGGTMLMIGGAPVGNGGGDTLREMDLAGDSLRETNIYAISAELAALGETSITGFSHDAQRLPNGDTAVLAYLPRTINVNGTPTNYLGDMVLVLDKNFQVAWYWDPYKWLDTSRLGTDGEGPGDWTHANAIDWSPEDGDLLVSLRAQDWVLKIDYGDGAGDGHIVWRLGKGGNFTVNDPSGDPYPWFSHQHDARYINDTTIVLFDDGNLRHDTTSSKDSRGQEWVLNEQTMTATLVVNADLGDYSIALGAAQALPNGNLDFNSGDLGTSPHNYGESIEVLPDGTKTFVQQMPGLEYRSYFMNTLYGPLANLVKQDATTQGTWTGTYGTQGYDVIGDSSNLPSYASVTATGQSTNIWAASTTDPRALLTSEGSNRIAAAWFSTTSFSVDVDLTDGQTHNLELYLLDWDNQGRSEQVQISDAATGLVLSTQTVSSFQNGVYLDYAITGHVVLTFTREAGGNAVLSGLFLDPRTSGTFLGEDTTAQGTWMGSYGSQGSDVIGGPSSLPSYATVTASGQSSYTWASSTTDPRTLQTSGSSRVAATWFSKTSFTVNVNLTDGQTHDLELYLLDWDNVGRVEQVQISDPETGVLSTQTISSFQNGVYLNYAVSGHIVITITNESNRNAVLNGLFLDPPETSSATAPFLKQNATTQGTWMGTYGTQGYDVIGNSSGLPAYAAVTATGESSYIWAASTTDPRALQTSDGSSRIAATWFSKTSFTVNVNLTDGQTHDLELYLLDWDNQGRSEQVQISDWETGAILSTQTVSSFQNGVYLDYAVTGHIRIKFTREAGGNAVLSGLFFDPIPATASFLGTDTSTKGNWMGTYGAQGYDVINASSSLPAYATVTPSGQTSYTWASSTTDTRGLQASGSGRVATTWFSKTSFSVDVNLTDGLTHDLELYLLDWDNVGRSEQVQISDASTGTVLSTQTVSSFSSGVYLDYAVSGNIVITITNQSPRNAVLSGLFLG